MFPNKELILRAFKNSRNFRQFKLTLIGMGFEINENGCNKYVFIHKKLDWVVKLVFGQQDSFPNPKNKISKYFLWPEFSHAKLLSGDYYELWFQEKVDCSRCAEAYTELMQIFLKEKIRWVKDNHDYNVGHLNGKPVIFDY